MNVGWSLCAQHSTPGCVRHFDCIVESLDPDNRLFDGNQIADYDKKNEINRISAVLESLTEWRTIWFQRMISVRIYNYLITNGIAVCIGFCYAYSAHLAYILYLSRQPAFSRLLHARTQYQNRFSQNN